MGQTIDWFERNQIKNPFSRPTRRERTDTRPREDWFSVRRPRIPSRSLFGPDRYTSEPQWLERTPILRQPATLPQLDMGSLLRPEVDLAPSPPVPDRAPLRDDLIWSDPLSYPDRVAPNLFSDPEPSIPGEDVWSQRERELRLLDEGDPWEPAPIQTALDALRPFEPHIQRSSEKWNVPADLLKTVIEIESGFKPRATSRNPETGLPIAFGLMQLTEDTAERFGVNDPYNPQQSIDGGAQYLRVLLDMFDEDTALALAAYNSGEGTVQKYEGVPPFPETEKHLSRAAKVFGRGWTAEQAEAAAPASLSYEEEFGVPDVPAATPPEDVSNLLPDYDEYRFLQWYSQTAKRYGLSPNPDDPREFYDYRAAYQAGIRGPGSTGHWPSRFKLPDHPNEVVGGFNTRTRERVPGTEQASEEELIALGWDAAAARELSGRLPEGTTFKESFLRGVELTKALYYAAGEAGGELIDHRGLTEWGRKGREEQERLISQYPKRKEAWGDEGISSVPEFFAYLKDTIGEQIPMMSTPLAGGLSAGAIARMLPIPPRLKVPLTMLGAFAPSMVLGAGETQMELKERNPNVAAPGIVFGAGSAIAALDSVLPVKIGNTLLKTFGADVAEVIARRTLFSRVKTVGKSAAVEGVTEALQGAISYVAAAHATDQPIEWPELAHAMREEGTAGLVMGPSVTVPTEVASAVGDRYRSRRDEQRAQKREDVYSNTPENSSPMSVEELQAIGFSESDAQRVSQQYQSPVTPDPTQEQAATPIVEVDDSRRINLEPLPAEELLRVAEREQASRDEGWRASNQNLIGEAVDAQQDDHFSDEQKREYRTIENLAEKIEQLGFSDAEMLERKSLEKEIQESQDILAEWAREDAEAAEAGVSAAIKQNQERDDPPDTRVESLRQQYRDEFEAHKEAYEGAQASPLSDEEKSLYGDIAGWARDKTDLDPVDEADVIDVLDQNIQDAQDELVAAREQAARDEGTTAPAPTSYKTDIRQSVNRIRDKIQQAEDRLKVAEQSTLNTKKTARSDRRYSYVEELRSGLEQAKSRLEKAKVIQQSPQTPGAFIGWDKQRKALIEVEGGNIETAAADIEAIEEEILELTESPIQELKDEYLRQAESMEESAKENQASERLTDRQKSISTKVAQLHRDKVDLHPIDDTLAVDAIDQEVDKLLNESRDIIEGKARQGAKPAATPAEPTTPAETAEKEASDTDTPFTLPAELKRSSPRYKDQELEFESDLDKALYIVREGRKELSRADAKFMSALRNHFTDDVIVGPILTDEQIREAGESVKERVRELSQADPDSGTLNIPSTYLEDVGGTDKTDKTVSDEALFDELEGLLDELDDDIQAMPGEGQPGLAEKFQLAVDKFRAKHGDSEAVGKLQNVVDNLVKAMEAGDANRIRIYKGALKSIISKGPKAFGGTDARKEKGETPVRPDVQPDPKPLEGVSTEPGTPTGTVERPVRGSEPSGGSTHGTPVVVDKAGADSPGVVGGSKPSVDVPGRKGEQPASDQYEIKGEVGQEGNTQKIKNNIAALELLKAIESRGGSATAAEQEILSRYVGWGGLPKVFETDHKYYQQLKDLLTTEEYEHARESTLNAHYTSKAIVDAVYTAIRQLGFTAGSILEPSVGIGNFFGFMPPRMAVESSLLGVELDSVTARMATLLYPKANIQEMGFQDAEIASNSIDVAVGNPPFLKGSKPVGGWKRTVPKHIRGLHNLFFLHALDKVRPGGIVAFVTSRYTLDSLNQTTRQEIEKGANFLGAIRLPETAFKKSAGTEVVTDIIFLQKRSETTPKKSTVPWISTGIQSLPAKVNESLPATVNEYFIKHPEMVIGKPSMTGTMYASDTYTVKDHGNLVEKQPSEFVKRLNAAIKEGLPSNIYTEESFTLLEAEQAVRDVLAGKTKSIDSYTKDSAELRARVPEGSYWMSPEGTLYVREDGRLVKPQRMQTKNRARLAVLLPLAAQVREVHRLERSVETTDKELKAARELLNEKYNAAINVEPVEDAGPKRLDHKGVIAAMGIDRYLQNDILGLDAYDPKTKELTKADIFTKRTITPQAEATEADSAQTALELVLSEKGRIDIPWMARVTGLSEQDVINQLLESEIFEIPTNLDTDQPAFALREDYLSGDVKTKLEEARRASTTHDRFQRNVRELEGVQPEDIQVGTIKRDAKMGAPWIPVEMLEEFAREFFNGRVRIEYAPSEGTFRVWPSDRAKNSRKLEGIHHRTAIKLFTEALNGVEPAEFDQRPHPTKEDSTISVLNPERTHSAQAAQDDLIREFKAWAFDGERGQELVQRYNEKLNRTRQREFDGSFLRMPGLNEIIKLRPHQKNVIWRALTSGSTLFAHVVGAGKTYAAIGTVMEWRRLGRAKKPLVVVPKALQEQWRRDFKVMYPHAKVLVSSTKNFSPQKRRRFFSQIKTGDWDAVIISHENLLKMSVSKERAQRWYKDQIRAWRQDLDRLEETRDRADSAPQGPTIKRIENHITRLTESLIALDDQFKLIQQDGAVFDEMGVDGIVVDEAHEFKNYGFSTTKGSERPGIKGIPKSGVKKSTDLMMKVDAIQEESNNRNVLFLTGTPVSNTLAELYVVQRFLQPQRLKDLKIDSFDAWLNQFGDVVNKLEPTASGVIRHVRRFRGFTNLKQLHKLFSEVADIKMQEDLNLPIPNIKRGEDGGVLNPVPVPVNEGYLDYVKYLAERAVLIQERKLEPTEENMLSITTKGRSSSLDMRLVGRDQQPGGKIEVAADKIAEIYRAGTENKETQLVFSDLGVPKERKASDTGGKDEKLTAEEQADVAAGIALERKIAGEYADFSVYQELKKQLIDRGVKESEIAFTHEITGGNVEKKRQELFDRTKAGEVRVLIGSTAKLGQGVNVQDRLKAVHMLDVPWKPAEIEQRLGRIFRQGNIFFNDDPNYEVAAYSYINEGSVFDEYLWGIQLNKLEGVKRAMRGEVETAEDMGESLQLNINQMMAIAANDPDLFREMELEPIIRKLEAERAFHENRAAQLKRDVEYRPSVIAGDKETLATEEVARDELARDVNDKNTPFTATIEGSNTVFKNAKEFGQALLKHLTDNVRTPEQTVVARLNDKITVEATFIGKHFWSSLGEKRMARRGLREEEIVVDTGAANVDTWKIRSVAEVDGEQWRGTDAQWRGSDAYFVTRDPEGNHSGTRNIHAGTDPAALTRKLEFYKTDAEKRVEAAKAELKANEETLQEEQETLEKLGGFERETELAELTQEFEDIKKRRAAATMEERLNDAGGGDVVAHMLEWEGEEYEGGQRPRTSEKRATSSPEKVKHPQQVLDRLLLKLRDIWGEMPVSVGNTSTRGAYHFKGHEIRIKVLGDVRALTHELGHAIDHNFTRFAEKLTSGKRTPEKKQTQQELIALGRSQSRAGYSNRQRVQEGFAEYLSRWLVDPDGQVGAHANLRVAAPLFTRQFEQWIHSKSKPAKALAEAQALFKKYLESDPYQRLDAQVIDSPGRAQALYNRVAGWLLGDPQDPRNAWDRMQSLLFDDLVRFDQMEKGLTGGTIGPEFSVYWMFRSLPGVTGKAQEIVESGPRDQSLKKLGDSTVVKRFNEEGEEVGSTIVETPSKGLYQIVAPLLKGTTFKRQRNNPYWLFSRYLLARRAQQYERLGLRSGWEDQRDMTETAMTFIENPLVAKAVKEYDTFVRAFRSYLVDIGALTQKQVDRMVETWGDTYVPFHRVAGAFQETDHYRREAGVTDTGLILKSVKGAFAPLQDPIQALAEDVFHFVKAAERNQAVYNLGQLSKLPGAAQWLSSVPVGKEPIRFNLQEVREQIIDALEKNPSTQEHDLEALLNDDFLQQVVTLWRPNFYTEGKGRYITAVAPNGKRKVWKIHDEGLWEAINTMQPKHVSAFVRFLAPPTRLVRATATMNAPFMVRNQGRDTGAAWMYSTNRKKGLRHTIWDMTKGFLLQVDMNFLQTEEQRAAWNEDFAQFKLSKAGQATFLAQDIDQMKRTVGSLNRTGIGRFVHNMVFSPLDALRGLRELGEISNRLGPMIRKRREAVAENNGVLTPAIVQQMGRVGRESTQDFWKMGSFLRGGWNTLAAFTAATVGGVSRIQEQWQKGNRARGRLAWKATQYFTFGLALWYMNQDDDEYDARPAWEKKTYHHINVHKLIDTFVPTESQRQELKDWWGDNPFFMMARMHEWGEIGNLLEAYAEWKIESDPRWAERLPFEGDSSEMYRLILALAPDAIMGPAEILTNYETFTGRPIVNPYDLNQEAELQYNRWTSPTFRWLGKETGMSPAKLEYAWYMWTTGVGKLATRGIDQAFFQDVPSPAAQVPYGELGVRAFYGGEAVGTADLNRLYDQSEALEGAMASIRTFVARNEEGDREKAIALAQEHGLTWTEEVRRTRANPGIRVEFPLDLNKPISRRRNVVLARTREAVRNIRGTRPQMERVFNSRTMTPEEKRMFLDDIVLDQVNYARSAFGQSPMKRNRYQSPLLQGRTPGR